MNKSKKTLAAFFRELDELTQRGEWICVKCLTKQFDKYIGDRKEYDSWMMGNTMMLETCTRCGSKENGILPYGDLSRAIRASHKDHIHPLEWD